MRQISKSPIKQQSDKKNEQNIQNKQKVKIIIRIRPTLNNESPQDFVSVLQDNTLKVRRPGNQMFMKFNHILNQDSDQSDVFQLVLEQIYQFLNGINNTIFAYGQTGAGKTYTILGTQDSSSNSMLNIEENEENIKEKIFNDDQRGILPRALEQIILELQQVDNSEYRLFISFFEVYNEKLYDLFSIRDNREISVLEIRENKNGEISIPDLISVQVKNLAQAYNILEVGLKNRAIGCTMHNSQSSRSHSIFQINLQQFIDGRVVESTLRIVDLAGSEKFKISHDISIEERELRIQELTCINGSLSCLGHCISALIDKQRTHIPFRNSKLTRVMQSSLSGNSNISFIICISPSLSSHQETFSTLQFANRAKKAILDGRNQKLQKINQQIYISEDQYNKICQSYEKEKAIRMELEKILQESGSFEKKELEIENAKLRKQNQDLKNLLSIQESNLITYQQQEFQQSPKNRNLTPQQLQLKLEIEQNNKQQEEELTERLKKELGIQEDYSQDTNQQQEFWKIGEEEQNSICEIADNLDFLKLKYQSSNIKKQEISKKIDQFMGYNSDEEISLENNAFSFKNLNLLNDKNNNKEDENIIYSDNQQKNVSETSNFKLQNESFGIGDDVDNICAQSYSQSNSKENIKQYDLDNLYIENFRKNFNERVAKDLTPQILNQKQNEQQISIKSQNLNKILKKENQKEKINDEYINNLLLNFTNKDEKKTNQFQQNQIKSQESSKENSHRKIQSNKQEATSVVTNLKQEMSNAINQLQLLQQEDLQILMLNLQSQ